MPYLPVHPRFVRASLPVSPAKSLRVLQNAFHIFPSSIRSSRHSSLSGLSGSSFLAGLPPCALLEKSISPVCQHLELALFDACEPVSEAATDGCVDGVDPEGFLVEERAHFNAELP